MSKFLHRWLTVSFLNLLLVAVLGFILRYKIEFSLPFIEQKYVLHSHSHFAFAGWITQTLMVLLIHHLALTHGEQILKKYRWLLYANVVTAYGMLISFFLQGYNYLSISFSTLSILVSYCFAIYYWKDLNRIKENKVSSLWIKAALAFGVFSSLGTFGLAYMMINRLTDQNWHLANIYFYLHFQYNGWFLFAGIGLLVSRLEILYKSVKNLKFAFLLFCFACIPAYLLSILWIPMSAFTYGIIIFAVIAQLAGWFLIIKFWITNKDIVNKQFSKHGKILLFLSGTAFSIKLLLQTASVHPALSQLSYGFRPIIIGYLHLVLLAVTSIFIIGYIFSFELIAVTKKIKMGAYIFIAGILINEILLMLQGVAALIYNVVPHINLMLLVAAVILFTGTSIIFLSMLKKQYQ
ncbi:hypothetical protein [Daejeonella oryzae]|uniref:hypothetical protein n=1 Tax=Daejeonella oryzae TaxID=1122943 RepID=UPI000420EA0E|nr:hypothetical protein [Daejeonella oryzae]